MRKTSLDVLAECKWELIETKEKLDVVQVKWIALTKWLEKNHEGKFKHGMDEVTKAINKRNKKLCIE
jgi:ribosomal protein L7Ae-like RNA K-turn-binding protein